MKKIKLLLFLALVAATANAQAVPHSASLSWTLSTNAAVTSQNVYRGACAGTVTTGTCRTDSTATFTKLPAGTALGPGVKTFTDSTVTASTGYIYYVTALCATCNPQESIPSNHIAVVIPADQPPPPTGLTITSVAMNITGTTQTVVAKWSDTSGTEQEFRFSDGNLFVAQGLTSSATGSFAEQWVGPAGTPITFIACNAKGSCASQAAK